MNIEDMFIAAFREILRTMQPRGTYGKYFEIAKSELSARGLWGVKPRGKPFQKGSDPRRGESIHIQLSKKPKK